MVAEPALLEELLLLLLLLLGDNDDDGVSWLPEAAAEADSWLVALPRRRRCCWGTTRMSGGS